MSGVARYRKQPVEVEAVRWEGKIEVLAPWMEHLGGVPIVLSPLPAVTVQTLHGDAIAEPGDWIIRGAGGDFWPCKPDVFAESYELVS